MKKGITDRHHISGTAQKKGDSSLILLVAVVAIGLIIGLVAGMKLNTNFATANQTWINTQYYALLAISSILVLGTIAAQHKDNQPGRKRSTDTDYRDELASQIPWTALKPNLRGESRNCRISHRSNSNRLLFSPIFSFQYTTIILATMVIANLTLTTLTARLPQMQISGAAQTTDPVFTTFICLFSLAVFFCVAWLLRKPVRALEFNKQLGVFWIEKYRVFGWKVGESAQMPIAQIHALQIIGFSKSSLETSQSKIGQSNTGRFNNPNLSAQDYEVNVVFHNGGRVNIISHQNYRSLKKDTAALAAFLDVPVWDTPPVTSHTTTTDLSAT